MRPKDPPLTSSIAARFSAAAPTYHGLALIQSKAARRLMEFVGQGPTSGSILEIGCGTGILTALLARAYPASRIVAVDISPAMIAEARQNLARNKMIAWIVADARALSATTKYPLIVSNCALHWIRPLAAILKKLAGCLTRDGRLAFAMMTAGTLAELHASRQRVAPHKPAGIILPAADEIKNALAGSGLRRLAAGTETLRQKYDSAEEMLRQLHDQGLTGGNFQANKNPLLTRAEIGQLLADYTAHYTSARQVYAGYQIFYGLAKKP